MRARTAAGGIPLSLGLPSRGGCDLKCAEYIEYVLRHEGDVAAVIAEPIRCTPFVPRSDYWQRVRAACDRHGTLLIFDEIPTGLGRTGAMFACQHFGVVPDVLVLGKGLGGGIMPLAAVIAREALNVAADPRWGTTPTRRTRSPALPAWQHSVSLSKRGSSNTPAN